MRDIDDDERNEALPIRPEANIYRKNEFTSADAIELMVPESNARQLEQLRRTMGSAISMYEQSQRGGYSDNYKLYMVNNMAQCLSELGAAVVEVLLDKEVTSEEFE